MDEKTIEEVENKLREIADEEDIELDTVLLFGSRTRNDYVEESDIDILVVSKDFEGIKWYKRGGEFQRSWDYQNLPTPEIICLTPEEFEERKSKLGDVVRRAVQEGVRV